MLNHTKVAQIISSIADTLFIDLSKEYEIAYKIWQKISNDPTFLYRVRQVDVPWPIPTWYSSLAKTVDIRTLSDHEYTVVAVDGSQIYPERHRGTSCYVINIGSALFTYKTDGSSVSFDSIPYVFNGLEEQFDEVSSIECVNAKRLEFELSHGVSYALSSFKENNKRSLVLFDGSLIFWHLPPNESFKRKYLSSYFSSFEQLYNHNHLYASYISLSRSKEIIHLLQLALCDFDYSNDDSYKVLDYVLDTHVMGSFLLVGHRTTVFCNNASISNEYPQYMRPHFFYINVGHEIGRVEIPAWIGRNDDLVDFVAFCIWDQCVKGDGYPVSLAESHEQAVIKGADREFFYFMLNKQREKIKKQTCAVSQKSIKKRRLGI